MTNIQARVAGEVHTLTSFLLERAVVAALAPRAQALRMSVRLTESGAQRYRPVLVGDSKHPLLAASTSEERPAFSESLRDIIDEMLF